MSPRFNQATWKNRSRIVFMSAAAVAMTRCFLPGLEYRDSDEDNGINGTGAKNGLGGQGGENNGDGDQTKGTGGDATTGTGGKNSGGDTQPPSVLKVSPNGSLLDGRAPVKIEFDEPITAKNSDVSVVLDTTIPIPGSIEVEGSTLLFRPDTPFNQLGTYVVTVATGVMDLAGNELEQAYEFDFISSEDTEQPDVSRRLDTSGSGVVSCPHLLMDTRGNAMALFSKSGKLYTSYYEAGNGWQETQELATGSDGALAMSPGGRSAVVYTASVGGKKRVATVMTELASGEFGAPVLADEGSVRNVNTTGNCTLNQQDVNIAVNDAGSIAVMWRGITPTGGDPYVDMVLSVKPADGSFGPVTNSSLYSFETYKQIPGIAMDSAGNVEASYYSFTGGDYELRTRSYSATTATWGSLTSADSASSGYARLHVDADDHFVYAFDRFDFPTSKAHMVMETRDAGGALSSMLDATLTSSASSIHLTTLTRAWTTWRTSEGRIGIGAHFEDPDEWLYLANFVTDANSADPVIATLHGLGTSETRGLVVWQSDEDIHWTSAAAEGSAPFVNLIAATKINTFPTGGTIAGNPRIVYDVPGLHGILMWTWGDAAELRVTEFHRRPPATP